MFSWTENSSDNLAPLRHVGDAAAGTLVGRKIGEVAVVEDDFAGMAVCQAHQRFQQGRFARSVAAEDGDEFTKFHLEGESMQDSALSVVAVGLDDAQHH